MEASMCRTCLVVTEGSIFKTIGLDQEELSLIEMLNECTGLKVTKSDGISLNICDNCTDEIINSYLYRRKCWDSHNFLLRRLEEEKAIDLVKPEVEIESENLSLTSNIKDEEPYTYITRSLMITHMNNIHDLDEIEDKPNYEPASDSEILEDTPFFESDEDKSPYGTILLKSDKSNLESVNCEICEKTFSSQNLLLIHLQEFHNVCEDEYTTECELENDLAAVHEVNNTLPDKELESLNSVPNILDPANIGAVTCEICDKIFARRGLMVRHMRDVHKIKGLPRLKYECKYCKKLVDKLSNLKRHILFIHEQPRDPPKCICHFCGMVFRDPTNFSAHLRRHTGEKPYKCDYCDYRATQRTCLTTHMRKHTGVRPYKCDICNKEYKTSSSLSNHRRVHSDETPFECLVCSKKFKKRSLWREHMFIHDPDKHVECTICGKKFARKTNLKTHMSQHTGEKKHVCQSCGEGFVQKICWKNHMKKCHNHNQ